jgi:cation diffusion facilitator CzcD-associated flavoprotein CzcO
MSATLDAPSTARQATPGLDYDAIVIGAGMSGMYQLIRLRELGLTARVFEAGTGVGGTWYWNRYPGARFDSESYSYGFSFDKELLQQWSWSEHFAPQPETLRYLNFVADKYDLRRDIQFRARVKSAHWDEAARGWTVTLEDGSRHTSRHLITGIGALSTPTMPKFEGLGSFRGQSWHTAEMPYEPVDFTGKRVAVIGTGATGVQTIQEVAKTCGSLTVFQRTPNWCAPLLNRKITEEEQREIKASYDDIFRRCSETFSCFLHTPDPRATFEVSKQEREAFWEKLYASPGFGIWVGNFKDILLNREANAELSEFVANKIRQRVKDPATAERLIPRNHGFGTRRVPLETKYYEVYNQPNVRLVDSRATPIQRITPEGLETSEESFAFDIIIYATGFDALTGAFDRIDFRGAGGISLKEKWSAGAKTFVGMMVDQFPNLFMLLGPHTALGNIPRSIEFNVEWVTAILRHMQAHGLTRADAKPDAVVSWMEHVYACAQGLLTNEVDSWMTGVNRNVEGKQTRIIARYSGSAPEYRAWCQRVAAEGYHEVALS